LHIKSNQIKFICDKNKHYVTHKKKQSRYVEYVDRTQRQYETALTSALKIKTLQQKFKFDKSTLEAGYSRRSNNIIRKGVPHINYTIAEKMTVSTVFASYMLVKLVKEACMDTMAEEELAKMLYICRFCHCA